MEQTKRTCKYRHKCGACQTLNLTYKEELSLKMKREIDLLGKYGHVMEIMPSDPSEHYRNKVQYLFQFQNGKTRSGIYRSSDGGIAEIDQCLMEDRSLTELYLFAKKLIGKYHVSVYDGKKGELRHIMIRKGVHTGEMSIAFVTRNGLFPQADVISDELILHYPNITSISAIINDSSTTLWMNGKEILIRGKGYINDELCGCSFRIPAKAFYQVNPYATEKLYDVASHYAQVSSNDRILDAYCGIGTVGIIAAKNGCLSLDGFDVNEDAVFYAQINAEQNRIQTHNYQCIPDTKFFSEMKKCYDVMFVDPPRAGCSKSFLSLIMKINPQRLVYISCNPATLSRDLSVLVKKYKIKRIQPVDMFPGTTHVETVCYLYHQK